MSDTSVSIFVKLGYWDAYRTAVVLTTRMFRVYLLLFAVGALLKASVLVIAALYPQPDKAWYESARDPTPLVWVIGLPALFVFVLPLVWARRATRDDRVKNGVRYEFSQIGIHVENSVGRADLKWAAIRRAIETRSAFLLLPTNNLAHTLPRRCFASRSDVDATRELLRANVPKARLRGKS